MEMDGEGFVVLALTVKFDPIKVVSSASSKQIH